MNKHQEHVLQLTERLEALQESQERYEMFKNFRDDEGYEKAISITKQNLDEYKEKHIEYLI